MQAEVLFHVPGWGIGTSGFRTCLRGWTREPVTCANVLAGTCQEFGRKELGSKFARPWPAVVAYGRLTCGSVGVGVCNADGSGHRPRWPLPPARQAFSLAACPLLSRRFADLIANSMTVNYS